MCVCVCMFNLELVEKIDLKAESQGRDPDVGVSDNEPGYRVGT